MLGKLASVSAMSLRHAGVSGRHPIGVIWCRQQAQYFLRCLEVRGKHPDLPAVSRLCPPAGRGLSPQIPPTLPALLTREFMRTGRRHLTRPGVRLHTRNGREQAMRIRRPGTGRVLTEAKATWDAGRRQRS